MRLRSPFRVAIGVALFAVAVGINYAVRPSAYEWYTGAPLDSRGTRVEFLIPRGWRQVAPVPITGMSFGVVDGTYVGLFPRGDREGVQALLQRLVPNRTDHASLSYFSSRASAEKFDAQVKKQYRDIHRTHVSRIIDLPDGKAARLAFADAKPNRTSIANPMLESFHLKASRRRD